jgi:hypothetical protein
MLFSSGGHQDAEVRSDVASERIEMKMPRLRRAIASSELTTAQVERPQNQTQTAETSPGSVLDPARFLLAIIELERVRGLRVHPESPTRH